MKERSEFIKFCKVALIMNFIAAGFAAGLAPWESEIFITDFANAFKAEFFLWVAFSIPGMTLILIIALLKLSCDFIVGFYVVLKNIGKQALFGKESKIKEVEYPWRDCKAFAEEAEECTELKMDVGDHSFKCVFFEKDSPIRLCPLGYEKAG